MGRFGKLLHMVWHCQYHIVWAPKYEYEVLRGMVAQDVHNCIHIYC